MKNQPAFPTGIYDDLSPRDYFAAAAMQAIINKTSYEDMNRLKTPEVLREQTAQGAYLMADAMLQERDKYQTSATDKKP